MTVCSIYQNLLNRHCLVIGSCVNMSGYQNLTQAQDSSQYKIAHSFTKCSCYLLYAQQSAKYSDISPQAIFFCVELITIQTPKLYFHAVDWKISRFKWSSTYTILIPQLPVAAWAKKSIYRFIFHFPFINKVKDPNLSYWTLPGRQQLKWRQVSHVNHHILTINKSFKK